MEENKESFEECINRINRKSKARRIKRIRMGLKSPSLEELAEIIKIEAEKGGKVKGTLDLDFGKDIPGAGVEVVTKYAFLGYNVKQKSGHYDNRSQSREEAFDDAVSALKYWVNPCFVEREGLNQICIVSPQKHYLDSD